MAYARDILNGLHQYDTVSGADAIPVNTTVTYWTTTGANAGTLADGELNQTKIVSMVVDAGVGTLTPANASGFVSVAFDDVGDWAIFKFNGRAWEVKDSRGITINQS